MPFAAIFRGPLPGDINFKKDLSIIILNTQYDVHGANKILSRKYSTSFDEGDTKKCWDTMKATNDPILQWASSRAAEKRRKDVLKFVESQEIN